MFFFHIRFFILLFYVSETPSFFLFDTRFTKENGRKEKKTGEVEIVTPTFIFFTFFFYRCSSNRGSSSSGTSTPGSSSSWTSSNTTWTSYPDWQGRWSTCWSRWWRSSTRRSTSRSWTTAGRCSPCSFCSSSFWSTSFTFWYSRGGKSGTNSLRGPPSHPSLGAHPTLAPPVTGPLGHPVCVRDADSHHL